MVPLVALLVLLLVPLLALGTALVGCLCSRALAAGMRRLCGMLCLLRLPGGDMLCLVLELLARALGKRCLLVLDTLGLGALRLGAACLDVLALDAAADLLRHELVLRIALRVEEARVLAEIEAFGVGVVGDDRIHQLLGIAQIEVIVRLDEGKCPALFAGPARAADAVDVVLDIVVGDIEVDHVGDIGDVDATSKDVGGHKHVDHAISEVGKRTLALVLAAVAVDRKAGDAGLPELLAEGIGAVLAIAEDDDTLLAALLQDIDEDLCLCFMAHSEGILLDRLGGGALVGNLDGDGVMHERARVLQDGFVERCAEEERLALFRHVGDDCLHIGQEAHIEHAVCLVEDEHLDLIQMAGILLHEVHETSRCGNEDVGAVGQRALLGLVGDAAHDRRADVMGPLCNLGCCGLDLLGKLACRREDKHQGAMSALGVSQHLHGRKEEGAGLACAGLCCRHDVVASQDFRDGSSLHRARLGVAEVGDCPEESFIKAERCECRRKSALLGGLVLG